MYPSLVLVLYVIPLLSNSANAYTWPDPRYDAVETLLYEGRRSDGSSLSSLVAPCKKRAGTGSSIPAEWLRFAFHDMATHENGTGGLDGSIVYELGRPENSGQGFNDTRDDFQAFANREISRSDVMAIGTVMAVSTCGGPVIPLRAGRVDAWAPQSGSNINAPHVFDSILLLRESFRRQGFSPPEMITLVACGHSMGGVRSSDFPRLVPPPSSNSSAPNIKDFDTTTSFDNAVVTEYLSGKTQNVLVITPNQTMASDLRVFRSDGNNTVKSLADPSTFASQCKILLGRMLDTVPSSVKLSDEVTLLPAKVNSAQLTFENKKLVFKVSFRLTKPINQPVPSNRVVKIYLCSANVDNKDCKNYSSALPANTTTDDSTTISPVTVSLGYTFVHYGFVVPVNSSPSISKFWFEVDDKDGKGVTTYKNGGGGYVVDQDQVLFVPTLSHVDVDAANTNASRSRSLPNNLERRAGGGPLGPFLARGKVYSLVVAVKTSFAPSRVYIDATDVATPNFTTPFNATVDLVLNSSSYPSTSGYDFYYGRVKSPGMQMTIDVHAVGGGGQAVQKFMSTLMLDNTPLLNPTDVTSEKGKGLRNGATRGVVVEALALGLLFAVWGLLLV